MCSDGLVKLFVLSVQPSLESRFNLKASLATSFHPTGGGGGKQQISIYSIIIVYCRTID